MQHTLPAVITHSGDYTLELTATSKARTNGGDRNIATATLRDNGVLLSGKTITFYTSGSAVFGNGGQVIAVITNSHGEATAPFIDSIEEWVHVGCRFGALDITQDSFFQDAFIQSAFYLSAKVLADHQPAIVGTNRIQYTLRNQNTNQAISDARLQFRVNGNAVTDQTSAATNSAGQAELGITSNIAQNVVVSTFLESDIFVDNNTVLRFISAPPSYRLTANVIVNNQPANGIAENQILISLIDENTNLGVPSTALTLVNLTVAFPSRQITTDQQGQYLQRVSSTTPGTLRYRVELTADTAVNTEFSIIFVQGYYPRAA